VGLDPADLAVPDEGVAGEVSDEVARTGRSGFSRVSRRRPDLYSESARNDPTAPQPNDRNGPVGKLISGGPARRERAAAAAPSRSVPDQADRLG
jgi:hypothetical protein